MTAPRAPIRFKRKLRMIPVKDIGPNPRNPREKPSRTEVSDIRQSLESVGEILVPLVVYENPDRRSDKDPEFILLDGERRWRAASELAQKNKKFAKVPANIISGPLSEYDNLRTMFNIHMKREEWSTAAVAEALNKIFRRRPTLKKASVKIVSYETGLGDTEVREAKQFLLMPQEDRERALSGDLDEYYLILLSRSMRSIQNGFPDLITESNWIPIAKTFIKKVDDGWIKDARSFNSLGRAARECLAKQRPALFRDMFHELLENSSLTPDDIWKRVEVELFITTEKEFAKHAKLFLQMLQQRLRRNSYRVAPETAQILRQISLEVEKCQS